MPSPRRLDGLRILVAEDSFLIAEQVAELIAGEGGTVVGPVPRVGAGLALIARAPPDCAVLDINLNGEPCFAIADALKARDIPFIFVTGYSDRTVVPPGLAGAPMLTKPLEDETLVTSLAAVVERTVAER